MNVNMNNNDHHGIMYPCSTTLEPSSVVVHETNPPTTTTMTGWKRRSVAWVLARTVLFDVPLALLFGLLLLVAVMNDIQNNIFVPFLRAASRTDQQLQQEYTYYHRSCTAQDITTNNANDLILPPPPYPNNNDTLLSSSSSLSGSSSSSSTSSSSSSSTTTSSLWAHDAMDTFMTHGGVVLPQILTEDTVTRLRHHIVQRNLHLSDVEEIPLSQGERRKSFAIDATEDHIVSDAIQQVASHVMVRPLLRQLVGDDDPAVSEITAITSYYGCPDQTWHQDVKEDGSPLKYGRTYTHSHSLFIPLQDTTAAMGATTLCPGTHYCANDGMADICEEYGMPLVTGTTNNDDDVDDEEEENGAAVWKAGDGALLSQHVWHRGAKHVNPDAPERIVLVMTFLARPNLATDDRRQLSRGTYFHMRWNMWGHTFQDLMDASYSMAKPFSVLRSLGLWKPSSRHWGYDLMTSGLLRCANNQMGMTYEELNIFVDTVMSRLRIPPWLQGPVTQEDDAWQIYLRETLDRSLDYVRKLNVFVLGPYLLLVTAVACIRRKSSVLKSSIGRLIVTHGILFLLAQYVLNRMHQSPFAIDLRANRLLMRAFPVEEEETESIVRQDGDDDVISMMVPVPDGPTTLPERDDILVGSRFDARFLGAFDRWLDYHPGNKVFRDAVADHARYYRNYSSLPAAFSNQVVTNILSLTTERGRYLAQDYRYGLWIVMSDAQAEDYVRQSLLAKSVDLLEELNREISYMLANYRFGLKRGTVLATLSQDILLHWRNDVLFPSRTNEETSVDDELESSTRTSSSSWPPMISILERRLPELESIAAHCSSNVSPLTYFHKRWTNIPSSSSYQVGDLIVVKEYGEWYRGSIIDEALDGMLVVSYEVGGTDYLDPEADEDDVLRRVVPIQEDVTRVRVRFGKNEWFDGTVAFVHPSREIDVAYDDGDYTKAIPSWRYKVLYDDE